MTQPMTPEREKEIREKSNNWLHPDNGTGLYAKEFIPELLAEIGRLRGENEYEYNLRCEIAKERNALAFSSKSLVESLGQLREKLAVAEEAIRHAKNCLSEIKESDLGMLGLYENLREALSKIRGEK